MRLGMVGLSHRTAPVEVRERFVFGDAAAREALARLVDGGAIEEAVLLSTCNRTEIYMIPAEDAGKRGDAWKAAAVELLRKRTETTAGAVERYVYTHRGRTVAEHLFRVASGLDSMVVGEAEIQGQVRAAYERAASLTRPRVVDGVMARLFERALAAGGRVRAETSLGSGAASVPSAAVELARKIFGSLEGRRALVLGAGDMSALALDRFAAEGVEGVIVANRTTERARELAERSGAVAVGFEAVPGRLAATEIVIAATAAPHPVLTREAFDRALPDGPAHALLIVDIALPRDVEPAIGEIDNVFLYDIDDVQRVVEGNIERRRGAVRAAEPIIAEEVTAFREWNVGRAVVPLIRALRGGAEEVRRAELERALSGLDGLSREEREAVEYLTKRLVNKMLHGPTVRLREAASNGRGGAVTEAARYLFALDGMDDESDGQ